MPSNVPRASRLRASATDGAARLREMRRSAARLPSLDDGLARISCHTRNKDITTPAFAITHHHRASLISPTATAYHSTTTSRPLSLPLSARPHSTHLHNRCCHRQPYCSLARSHPIQSRRWPHTSTLSSPPSSACPHLKHQPYATPSAIKESTDPSSYSSQAQTRLTWELTDSATERS